MSDLDFPVHEIHVSEIREFKKCRFSWQLKFVHQFYPKITAKPLEFGTAYHAAKEVFYDPEKKQYPKEVRADLAIQKFRDTCIKQRETIEQITEEQAADYKERLELGVGMLNYYFNELSDKLEADFEPLAVEQKFSVPIANMHTGEVLRCDCDKCWKKAGNPDLESWEGLPVHLEGKIDLILRDTITNRAWLLDWKTTARIANTHEWLELDEQIMNYLVAMWLLGYDVAGFMYHESLKTYPQKPKLLARARNGCLYSTAKTQDTDYSTFIDEVSLGDQQGLASGAYDDYLLYLQNEGKRFYHRENIRKDRDALRLAYNDLYDVAVEITNNLKVIYPSPTKYNCMYCEFVQVCIGRATNADYEYTLETQFEQKAPYYEQE